MASHSDGGFTCCVPGCFSNSKRDVNLSFYGFPKEKKLRSCWLRKISQKNFSPSTGHQVCSLHFEGGKKTYMNNVPVIFPLAKSHLRPSSKPGLQHRVKRHRLQPFQRLQAQKKLTSPRVVEHNNRLND